MNSNRWFFLVGIPALWGAGSLTHFHFPGDEYALWGISSAAGTWICFLLPGIGDIHQPWIHLSVAGTGMLVMAGVGWVLMRLGVRKRGWSLIWLAASAGWLLWFLSSFPSLERALAKNGSWAAYVLSALLLGMYAAAPLSIIATLVWRRRAKTSRSP